MVESDDCRLLLEAVVESGFMSPSNLWFTLGEAGVGWYRVAQLVTCLYEMAVTIQPGLSVDEKIDRMKADRAGLATLPEKFEFGTACRPGTKPEPRRADIIDGLLTAAPISAIIAQVKAGKTTFSTAVTGSLVSGMPLLGRKVNERKRVWMISAETPKETVFRNLENYLTAGGKTLGDCEDFQITERLPQITDSLKYRDDFRREIIRGGFDVVIFDSLSVMTGQVDFSRQSHVVEQLQNFFGWLYEKTGAAIAINHHAKSAVRPGSYIDLADIKGDGVAGWVDQWFLLNRERPFHDPGDQDFLLSFGSRAPHSGRLEYRLNEHSFTFETFDEGELKSLRKKIRTEELKNKRCSDSERVFQFLEELAEFASAGRVAEAIRVSPGHARKLLREMAEDGVLVVNNLPHGKRTRQVFGCK